MRAQPSPFPVNFYTQRALWDIDSLHFFYVQTPVACSVCGLEFWAHAVERIPAAGAGNGTVTICADCAEFGGGCDIVECDICSARMFRESSQTGAEYQFCAECYENGYARTCTFCDECEESDSSYIDENGDYACHDCRRRRYTMCDSCRYWVRDSEVTDGLCTSCRPEEEEEEEESGPIAEYHTGPRGGWSVRRLAGEHTGARSYGIEIEVERGTSSTTLGSSAEDVMSYGRGLFHCESDGSLDDGFEIISQPCTLGYWAKSLRAGGAARNMLDNARRAGLVSHDTSTCGLHVHVGRAQLSRCAIFKLIAFSNANPGYLLTVSRRRNEDNLQRWANPSVGRAAVTYSAGQLAKKGIQTGVSSSGRYVAINVTHRTVEVRIFRGSLIAATVLGAVQWIDALIDWCNQTPLARVSAPNSWESFAAFAASSPAGCNRAELAQSDLYLRRFATQPRLPKKGAV